MMAPTEANGCEQCVSKQFHGFVSSDHSDSLRNGVCAALRDCENAFFHSVIAQRAVEELNEGVIDFTIG